MDRPYCFQNMRRSKGLTAYFNRQMYWSYCKVSHSGMLNAKIEIEINNKLNNKKFVIDIDFKLRFTKDMIKI